MDILPIKCMTRSNEKTNKQTKNFCFADESPVFNIMLKEHVRVQLVFLIIYLVGPPSWNMSGAINDISRGDSRREIWNGCKKLLELTTLLIFAADQIR